MGAARRRRSAHDDAALRTERPGRLVAETGEGVVEVGRRGDDGRESLAEAGLLGPAGGLLTATALARGEVARDDGRHCERGEGEPVARGVDHERVRGRQEEEVEGQGGGEAGRKPPPEAVDRRHAQHREQIEDAGRARGDARGHGGHERRRRRHERGRDDERREARRPPRPDPYGRRKVGSEPPVGARRGHAPDCRRWCRQPERRRRRRQGASSTCSTVSERRTDAMSSGALAGTSVRARPMRSTISASSRVGI